MKQSSISVVIVTWNSEKYIKKCILNIYKQTYPFSLLVIDNNSEDRTIEILENLKDIFNFNFICLKKNIGFCGGHNLGIRKTISDFYMPLNPDIYPEPNYIKNIIEVMQKDCTVGISTGKLYRLSPKSFEKTNIIDSKGIYIKKNLRSLDIEAGTVEDSKVHNNDSKIKEVFGASGASAIYRRKMIKDITLNKEFFFDLFFAYREDVDVSWRARLRGWKCLYVPSAIAYHVRHNTPEKRKQMSSVINMNSVKNRIIMLYQNQSKREMEKNFFHFFYYDILIILYVFVFERTSIEAFSIIFKNRKIIKKRRRIIQESRKASNKQMLEWEGNKIFKEYRRK